MMMMAIVMMIKVAIEELQENAGQSPGTLGHVRLHLPDAVASFREPSIDFETPHIFRYVLGCFDAPLCPRGGCASTSLIRFFSIDWIFSLLSK